MSKTNGKKVFAIALSVMLALIIATIIAPFFVSLSELVTSFIVGTSILAIVIFIFAFIWTKRNKTEKKNKRRVLVSLLSIASIAVIVLNGAILNYVGVIDQYLSAAEVDEEAVAAAEADSKAMTEKVSDEGMVLLENKNDALPLDTANESEKNVNVFGQASVKLVYGGSGSGAGDESNNINLQQGLENAGFTVNADLTDFYQEHKPEQEEQNNFNLDGGDYTLSEPAPSDFSDELLTSAEEFSDVALVTLARSGGEGGDLPMETSEYGGSEDRHYLEISEAEQEMIDMVTSMDFEKVIVVINSSNAMELGFLENEGIDGAIWVGGPGSTGMNSFGKILAGTVNPSGRLADTYAYDVTSSPAFYNQGDFKYTNTEHTSTQKMGGGESQKFRTFLNYEEGIYVGYRYYETRYVDNETREVDEAAYSEAVQYPFGYGQSYTDFTQEITDYTTTDDTITMTVDVTNTGDVAGKEVVQLYYTAPYYEGEIEKSHVVLGAFDKTETLEPGATETITLELAVEDMASYDYANEEAYVLDEGTYNIKLMNNAHEVIDSRDYEVSDRTVYNEGNKRDSDQVAATNQFEDAQGDLTFVSRADWEGTLPTERTENKEASQELVEALQKQPVENNPDDEDVTFADHGLDLEDMAGLPYDDPQWDQLLEQLSVADMSKLIGHGGYSTAEIESINKPQTIDYDGPAGINSLLTGLNGVQFMSEVVLASTWNTDLAQEMGETLANEAEVHNISGLYAPSMNIHRTPFSGRNFEYYSEDGFLSGKIGAAEVAGINSKGVYTYIKHYALNDQETNRDGVATWSNEQAIREIYLEPFELSVKEGGSTAVMSAFNRIGTVWAGEHEGLLQDVLRNEWGFRGMVITDMDVFPHMHPDHAIRNGGDLMLSPVGDEPTEETTETNTGHQAMRQASHNILYTVANSNVFDVKTDVYPLWAMFLGIGNVLALGLIALGFYKIAYRKPKQYATDNPENI
ncbi:glycoside hydrolase family 3 protein [Paraliobacillus ryukyuensis]|uniref:glycoside hydrolase family 3 protein n=1 Tax=Paraliobacillus ryukyuensis TaxID=200904 RepID=UPI002118B43F|nr:glycoside hydrolase family 3 N-terminal domain-containing protein [Paraliobacillus ryukyuensis]